MVLRDEGADLGDGSSGLVHTVIGITTKAVDITHLEDLLHGDEQVVLGDAGYRKKDRTLDPPEPESDPYIVTSYQPSSTGPVRRRSVSSIGSWPVGARVEHPVRVVK